MRTIFRVQGRDGRGPYAPGFSGRWVDDDGPVPPPTCFEEFGESLSAALDRLVAWNGGACGCGLASAEDASLWWTPLERHRLLKLRFNLVRMQVEEIVAESSNQIVFWRKRPLRDGALIVPWPAPLPARTAGEG